MRKKWLFSLLLISSAMAEETHLVELKQQWQAEQQQSEKDLQRQRNNFLQLESLLQAAEKQQKITPTILRIAEQLVDKNYPLYAQSQWLILKAKFSSELAKDPAYLAAWIRDFSVQFPEIAKQQQLEQRLFEAYYQQQQFSELLNYSQQVAPQSEQNQCRVLSAQYQLRQAENSSPNSATALFAEYEKLWLTVDKLPLECESVGRYWEAEGLKTADKIQQKAVNLFLKNQKKGLDTLVESASDEQKAWLQAVRNLRYSAKNLPNFAEKQPLTSYNKTLVQQAFNTYIRTLPEQQENPDFSRYGSWVARWQLDENVQREWKIAFITRFFDNKDPIFQLWRDEQLQMLKADTLTERRLRMAIWQQSDLKPWLALLSTEAKRKAEWRYWIAKSDPTQRNLWQTLAQERGFYPMLAASALNQPYRLAIPKASSLSESQKMAYKQPLAVVAEWRYLQRFGQAKQAWLQLLQGGSFEQKLALADYALERDWYDLAVEATIQAKAWDYLSLRLPYAYANWFALHLEDKPIRQSFAMAIARQESAWNVQARSHANAIGLMQMLPSTAAATADYASLPYQNERDLLNPFRNIMLGTAHLAQLNEKYPNNRILIAAAYNAGASRVERWLTRANGKLAMDEFVASIPFYETRGYVQNVLAYDFYYQYLFGGGEAIAFYPEERGKY